MRSTRKSNNHIINKITFTRLEKNKQESKPQYPTLKIRNTTTKDKQIKPRVEEIFKMYTFKLKIFTFQVERGLSSLQIWSPRLGFRLLTRPN